LVASVPVYNLMDCLCWLEKTYLANMPSIFLFLSIHATMAACPANLP